jgi:hypothetical protein
MRPLNRITPRLPEAYATTYQIMAPATTHRIQRTCAQVQCQDYLRGWTSHCDPNVHAAQIHYIRTESGRRFRERVTPEGLIAFDFYPGQECFARPHTVRDEDVAEVYVVRQGDYRTPLQYANPVRMSGDNWLESFAANQDRLTHLRE